MGWCKVLDYIYSCLHTSLATDISISFSFFLITFKWLHDSGVIYSVYTGKKVPQDSEDSTSPIGKHNIQQLLQKIRGIIIFHCNDYA